MRTFVFGNHFEAAVAAAHLRNDGYAVEVYDESVAALWGPMTVGGVRMVVEPARECECAEETLPLPAVDGPVDKVLRWTFLSVLVCGGLCLLFGLLFYATSDYSQILMVLFVTVILFLVHVVVVSLIAESTRRLVTHPLVLWGGVLVLLVAKLLIG
ncbi:hypothetical protein AAFN60_18120 [Roseibacillus persicicus]|uniref:hypothetical protein n=1 Tax=Roseibacillus persicicus TaxID=454148 RepID=UPI00398BB25D